MVWYLLLPSIPIWSLRYFGHMRVKGLLYGYCMYVCVCMCACMCMCVCMCIHMCVCVCVCLRVHVCVCVVCLCLSVSVCACHAISQHTLQNTRHWFDAIHIKTFRNLVLLLHLTIHTFRLKWIRNNITSKDKSQ